MKKFHVIEDHGCGIFYSVKEFDNFLDAKKHQHKLMDEDVEHKYMYCTLSDYEYEHYHEEISFLQN
jgi:hypothetical protein